MSRLSRSRLAPLLVLAAIGLTFGCSSTTTDTARPVVVFSDVHFNPFYDPNIFPSLLAADPDQWPAIFQGSTVTSLSAWGEDTNYLLFMQTLTSINQNLGAAPLVIFTGDFLGHHFDTLFYSLYGSQDVAAMRAFSLKTVQFFVAQVRLYCENLPVMFVLGNNDEYEGDYLLAPNSPFLSDTAELFYSGLLLKTADQQTFLNTYKAGGYYVSQPLGNNMVVIALNTVFLTPDASGVAGIDGAIQTQLTWLETTLASAKASGNKVWLLMHVPPGADEYKTASSLDGGSQIATAGMMMQATYQASLLQILSNYPGIITMSLAGHTHMDEYRNMLGDTASASEIVEITPSISPRSGNDPAFKIITFSNTTFEPADYSSLNYDLSTLPAQFNSYYTFSTAYSMHGYMNADLTALVPELATASTKQGFYRGSFYSGHDSASSITNSNWPVYWCGIGKMVQQNIVDCVNGYKQ
ncbi:MAG: metallophosphoesterase [Myxococcota bacterium]|jgi:hypothetical protein